MCDGKFCVAAWPRRLQIGQILLERTHKTIGKVRIRTDEVPTASCAATGHHADGIVWDLTPCPQPCALVDNTGSLFYCKLLVATSDIIALM